jgi:hypothetical protein
MRFFDRRWVAGDFSKTLILPLRSDGRQTTQHDPKARLGLYIWEGKMWQLEGIYYSRQEARSPANRVRKNSN